MPIPDIRPTLIVAVVLAVLGIGLTVWTPERPPSTQAPDAAAGSARALNSALRPIGLCLSISGLLVALLVIYYRLSRSKRPTKKEEEEDDAQLGIDFSLDPDGDALQKLQNLYDRDRTFAKTKIKWYFDDAKAYGDDATAIRTFTIVVFILGTLCPLFDAARPGGERLGPWGYVFLAFAAGLVSFDRYGGLSWRWTRSTLIWVTLRRVYAGFEHEWVQIASKSPEERLEALKKFRLNVDLIISQECNDWGAMMEQMRREMENATEQGLKKGN